MAFTTQTKIWINDAHVISCSDDTLHLSGNTIFGTSAAYQNGMPLTPTAYTIPDVDFVTGLTSAIEAITDIAITGVTNGLTKVGLHDAKLGGILTENTVITVNNNLYPFLLCNGSDEFRFSDNSISIGTTPNGSLAFCDGRICIYGYATGTTNPALTICSQGTCGIKVTTDNLHGIEYTADYSTTFTDNSLITKKYVTSQVSGITSNALTGAANGLTKVGQTVKLGGTLTATTTINGGQILNINQGTLNLSGNTAVNITSPSVNLVTAPGVGTLSDLILVRETGGTVKTIAVSSITGNTYTKAQIDAYTATTNARLDGYDVWTGITETRVDNLTTWSGLTEARLDAYDVWSAATESRLDLLDAWTGETQPVIDKALTGVTGTHLGTVGRNVCLDATAVCIVDNALTGSTNGLTDSGRIVKLGGVLTEKTTLTGAQEFSISVNEINLTGNTGGVNLGGTGLYIPATLPGSGSLLCIGAGNQVGLTSISAFGGLTGATNGLTKVGQVVELGGQLTKDTQIGGGVAGNDLYLGTAVNELANLYTYASGNTCMESGTMSISSSGATFNDLSAVKCGIVYGGDYSASFVNNSLVTKLYVDTVATGLIVHNAALVATTTGQNLDLSGIETVDGLTTSTGMRVLVKNQTDASQNGVYIANDAGAWTRATDMDWSPAGEITNGDLVPVTSGLTQNNSIWVITTPNPITSGDTITFTQFATVIDMQGGAGINISMNGSLHTVCVNLGGSEPTSCGLSVDSNGLCIASSIAGTGLTYTNGVLGVNAISGGVTGIPVRVDGSDNLVVNKSDISTALGGVITGATNGLTESPEGTVILGGSISTATNLNIAATGSLTITDSHGTGAQTGIVYAADYSDDYVARSLVDAAYVTGLTSALSGRVTTIETDYVTGGTNGITKTSPTSHEVKLGGGITEFTQISGNSQVLRFGAILSYLGAFDVYAGIVDMVGSTCVEINGPIVKLTQVPSVGTTDDMLLVRDATTCEIQQIAVSAITSSLIPVTGASNGLTVVDKEVELGGTLTKPTTINVSTYDFKFSGDSIQYFTDYSSTYVARSLVDAGYVTGLTNGLETRIEALETWSGITETRVDNLGAISGITLQSITGVTNGLTKVGDHSAKLGGTLCESTNIALAGNVFSISSGTTDVTKLLTVSQSESSLASITGAKVCATADAIYFGTSTAYGSFEGTLDTVALNTDAGARMNINGTYDFIELITSGGSASCILIDGINNCINIDSATNGTINMSGTVVLQTVPADGDTTTDYVLVRDAGTGAIQQIPSTSLGQNNNDYSMTVVAASTGLTTGSTYAILVNSPTAAVTLTLPATPFDGQAFRFKDAGGQALTYNITIIGNGNNIDSDLTAVINTDYGALELMFNATLDKWLVMSFVN